LNNDIIILGITDGHNAGACLVRNGILISAISEERLSRIKNEAGYPRKAVRKVLEISGIQTDEITYVALAGKFTHKKEFYSGWDWYKVGINEQLRDIKKNAKMNQIVKERLGERKNEIIKDLKISENKIIVVEHHLAHAASAYFSSPWVNEEKVLILTCDGSGDGISSTVSIGELGKITRIGKTENNASLGKIYSRITLILGMKPWEHEYKVMGLAPYADENGVEKSSSVIDSLIEIPAGSIEFKTKTNLSTNYCYEFLKTELENHRFDWIAGAMQRVTEDLLIRWIHNAIEKTGIRKVVCAGGVFMNVKANMKIADMKEVDNIFIFPSGGDESLGIGAAFNVYAEELLKNAQEVGIRPLGPLYLGPEFSAEEIDDSIKKEDLRSGYSIEFCDDVDEYVAELLSEGKVVARFNGRMEWGARSLGNRSILADPSRNEKLREINTAIKQRDFWMPFAPTILFDKNDEFVINPKKIKAPYMVMAYKTKERARTELIAAIHPYDFTARPQILEKEHNVNYYKLIKEFEKLTGIPAVLNTSFNLHGYPIVCSPMDAIKTLKNSGLEILALGNYLIKKNP
jgi:carbamoyltransferase